jgi:hypothetical protein
MPVREFWFFQTGQMTEKEKDLTILRRMRG